MISRRQFLHASFASLLTTQLSYGQGLTSPQLSVYPFTLGVASGAPLPDGVVLWTRLAPAPLQGGGMPPVTYAVHWQVAHDEQFQQIVQQGTALAQPGLAHSVHVEVTGLQPARWYFYRFEVQGMISQIGRTRTAPPRQSMPAICRLAYASCQHYEHGYFGAYQHMLQENLDLVLFVGDYIYEYGASRNPRRVRHHNSGEVLTLEAYRNRYALYKQDPDLQAMHAAAPWLLVWDDHEVSNDYANDQNQTLAPNFMQRRAVAYQAYFEHQPLRPSQILQAAQIGQTADFAHLQIYGQHTWGRLANFFMLDDRQYRAYQACPKADMGGSNTVNLQACPSLRDGPRSLLGMPQEAWLTQALTQSSTRWNYLIQQTLLSRINLQSPEFAEQGPRYWTDGWDGYPAARERLFRTLAQLHNRQTVIVGGDVHANWVCDVTYQGKLVASEFCGTSITSPGWAQEKVTQIAAQNPHVKFVNSEKRGYGVMHLTPNRLSVTLRAIDDATKRTPAQHTLAQFEVDAQATVRSIQQI